LYFFARLVGVTLTARILEVHFEGFNCSEEESLNIFNPDKLVDPEKVQN
jgi:hypothetical protein